MRFEVLGPLRVRAGGVEITIGSGRERALLAVLLLHANRTVLIDQLVEAIWEEKPPPGVRNQLQGCVSRLRKRLATTGLVIVTEPAGYRATLPPENLDLLEFRRLVGVARTAAGACSHADTVAGYRAALDLWRGPALGGVDTGQAYGAVALDEEHVQVQEECIEAELAAGGAGRLVPELTELVSRHPHRERLHRALMLALYRADRQADALAAYRHARTILHDELGIEPGAELQRLHQAILNRDPDLDPPTEASDWPPTPRELPADVTGFTGRADALKTLDELLADNPHGNPAPVVISAIAGTAGVGKTALAVHWAHRVADRFPDGQLYLNLRGYAATTPVRPIEALSALLRSLGTPPEQIPTDEAQAAALYRTQLAGRRALVVLDNARSVDQVRPLLPGTPGCLVLVTSRDRLTGLVARDGATRITLDVLTPDEARTLLSTLLGHERTKAEPAALADLAAACAYLPLAIRLAAELAVPRPTAALADLVADLSDQQQRLELLDGDGDPSTAVQVVFSWSVAHLPTGAARAFRLLGLHPGPDFDSYAVAALANTRLDGARHALDQLARAHMIHSTVRGRYGMHDLLRAYATHQATFETSGDERRAALSRMFDYYLATAAAALDSWDPIGAHRRLRITAADTPTPELADPDRARTWLDAELPSMVAVATYAATHGWPDHTIRLSCTLSRFIDRGRYTDALAIHGSAYAAAHEKNDTVEQAHALRQLGISNGRAGRLELSAQQLRRALALFCEIGDGVGEAATLNSLGNARRSLNQYKLAAESHAQALTLFRQLRDLRGEASALNSLGCIEARLDQYQSAVNSHKQALALFRQVRDQVGEASALNNLSDVLIRLGECQSAADYLHQALVLARQLGHSLGEAIVQEGLGTVHLHLGQPERASEYLGQALDLFRKIDDWGGESSALNGLGEAANTARRPHEALTYHTDALARATSIGINDQRARALTGLAKAYRILGDADLARTHYEQALSLYRELEIPDAHEVSAELISLVGQEHPASSHGSARTIQSR